MEIKTFVKWLNTPMLLKGETSYSMHNYRFKLEFNSSSILWYKNINYLNSH